MRARYTAYVTGAIDFIVDSTHSRSRKEIDLAFIQEWSQTSLWRGLEIFETKVTNDNQAYVSFEARYTQHGKDRNHREKSLFEREEGKWRFVDGEEQLRRIHDDVVAAGRDRLGLQLLDRFASRLVGIGEPRIVLDVLVADQLRAIDDRPRLEVPARAIGGGGRELRIRADEPLGDARSFRRAKVLLFVDEKNLRVDEGYTRNRERRQVRFRRLEKKWLCRSHHSMLDQAGNPSEPCQGSGFLVAVPPGVYHRRRVEGAWSV